jgi:hypothetical protein
MVMSLGAFSSEARAAETWRRYQRDYPFMPRGKPQIWVVSGPKLGRLYRLRSQPMSQAAAEEGCRRLRLAGEACSIGWE